MNKFNVGDLVVPSRLALSEEWWVEYKDLKWPQIVRAVDKDGDVYLESKIGCWGYELLEHLEEENE